MAHGGLAEDVSTTFLGFVSVGYIVLGVLGGLALLTMWEALFGLAAFISLLALVTPVAIVESYGIQALCISAGACEGDKVILYKAQVGLWVLSILAISAGALTAFGSLRMRRGEKLGYRIWLPFVVVSVVVALWNVWYLLVSSRNPLLPILQLSWALLYALAYACAFREFRTNRL